MTGRPRTAYRDSRHIPAATPAPALRFDLTCPACGADLEQKAAGVPGRFRTSTVCACSECPKRWIVAATIREVERS